MEAPIPDYSKVTLLLPMSGANNGTTFTDYSPNPKTITVIGGAKTVTAQSKFYGSSGAFDGSTDALSVPNSTELQLGAGDCRVGLHIRPAASQVESFPRVLAVGTFQQAAGAWALVYIASSRTIGWDIYRPTALWVSGGVIAADTWSYIEFGMSAGNAVISVDGVIKASVANSTAFSYAAPLIIGAETNSGSSDFTGHLQDVCIQKGSPPHTENFTPPTRLLGSISVETRGESGVLVPRKVFAVPRSYPGVVKASTTTDASGVATLSSLPACEYSVVAMADGNTSPDLVLRRLAA